MMTNIRNEKEFKQYKAQLKEVIAILVKQQALEKDARIQGQMLKNLNKLHSYLEKEILIYMKIQNL